MQARLTMISFALAAGAAIFLLVVPVYSGFDNNRPTHATLLDVNGAWAIIPVLFPVLIAFLPVLFRKQWLRITATILMGGFAFIAGFTIRVLLPAGSNYDAAGGVPCARREDRAAGLVLPFSRPSRGGQGLHSRWQNRPGALHPPLHDSGSIALGAGNSQIAFRQIPQVHVIEG